MAMSANLVWHRETLPNGLTVLLYPRQSANTAQLSVAVKYGSVQEPKDAGGIAHFLEHMIAGGSEKRIQRSRSIEDCGGVSDFYADREYVLGMMDVLPQKLTEASAILSELFFGNDFDEEKFETERKIILNELAEVADDPDIRVEELLLGNLFKQHPVRRPVGGYPKTVKRLTLSQLKQEHNASYVPQNMILILTGNFMEKDAKCIFDGFDGGKGQLGFPKQVYPVETFKPESMVVEDKAGITQTYLSIGARTVCASHIDAPALDLVSVLLGGGTSSRLFIELRERHAVTYDVDCSHGKGLDYGYLRVNCAVNNKKAGKARILVLKELAKLRTEKVSAAELERAKQIVVGGILRGLDNPQDTLDILSFIEIQFGSELGLERYLAKVNAVTGEEIREAAVKHLDEDCLCTAILNPTK